MGAQAYRMRPRQSGRALGVAVDRDHLSRYRARRIRGQEDGECGNVGRIDEMLDRLVGQYGRFFLFQRAPAHRCAALEYLLQARTFHGAGQDGVDPDAEFAELARNMLQYAGGGHIRFAEVLSPRKGLEAFFEDRGPGIADLDGVLDPKYRSMTGMGMGLRGSKRIADEFLIDTQPGDGTRITMRKYVA